MVFRDRLKRIIESKSSFVCVGLDTDHEKIPANIVGKPSERMLKFNTAIIDATSEYAAAYKLNSAFYEAYGAAGFDVLEESVKHIPEDTLVIVDAKRGDIGNTARQYAKSVFEILGAGAVTLNPYMGSDSMLPFLEFGDRGCFMLCLTSNKGANDFQKRMMDDGRPFYLHVAETIVSWNDKGNAGMVVGATQPEELDSIRELAPDIPLLIPGIGAQGGDLEKTVEAGIGVKNAPALINSSRGIIFSSKGADFAESARSECMKLRDSINRIISDL